jgi:hypothetical protein
VGNGLILHVESRTMHRNDALFHNYSWDGVVTILLSDRPWRIRIKSRRLNPYKQKNIDRFRLRLRGTGTVVHDHKNSDEHVYLLYSRFMCEDESYININFLNYSGYCTYHQQFNITETLYFANRIYLCEESDLLGYNAK